MAAGLYQLAIPVAQAVEKWRKSVAPTLPIGVALAIAERESGFSPTAVPLDKKTGKPRSTAVGVWQILKGSAKQYGITPEQRTDVNLASRGAVKVFDGYAKLAKSMFPNIDSDSLSESVYLGHWQGTGSLKKALTAVKKQGLKPTAENLAKQLGVSPQPLLDVQRKWRFWQQASAELGGNWSGLLAWADTRAKPVLASLKAKRPIPVSTTNYAARGGGSGGGGAGGALLLAGAAVAVVLVASR